MLELRQRTSRRQKFEKLQLVTVPILYIFETVMFFVKSSN